jgi:ABC-2 type transport system permease protein
LLVPLLMVVFTIAVGTRAVAGDEEAGTLDLLLAHPVSRTRAAVQRYAALAASIVGISAVIWLVMVAMTGPAQLDGVSSGELAATAIQLALFAACFGALAFAIGAAIGRKAPALGGAAGIAVLAYLANSVIPQVNGLQWTRRVSPFHWYLGGEPLKNGLQLGDSALLLAVTVALVAAGTWAFNRRDIAV